MIRASTLFFTHLMSVMLRDILIILFILFSALLIWFKVGIQIDSLKIADYDVNGLYIKLDKKFTLTAQSMDIPQKKANPSFVNLDEVFDNIKYLLSYCEYVELKNIKFKNNTLNVVFADEVLYVTSDDYEIAGNIQRDDRFFDVDVSMLYLKKEHISMSGNVVYDSKEEHLKTQGNFDAFDIKGGFFAQKIADEISFELFSDSFTDLHPLIAKFELGKNVKSWILDKIKAQSMKVTSFSAKANVSEKKFTLDLNSLKGKAVFDQVAIHFKENLPPVFASELTLGYENDTLDFELKNPLYEERSLEGSHVAIHHVSDKNATLNLSIKTNSALDTTMQTLLKAYNLKIPVIQESGVTKVAFDADFGLVDGSESYLVDANLSEGIVWLNKIRLPLQSGALHYKNGSIRVVDVALKENAYEAVLNGDINLTRQQANLDVVAKRMQLIVKDKPYLTLQDQNFTMTIDYQNQLQVSLPQFTTRITQDNNETRIEIDDVTKIKPYFSESELLQEGGNLEIKTKDYSTFEFKGILKKSSCVLYENNEACRARVPFTATLTPKEFEFYAFDKRLYYVDAKSHLSLKDINVDLEKLLNMQSKQNNKAHNGLYVSGKNSHLRYGKYTLLTDDYEVEMKPNGDIEATGSMEGDAVHFSKNNALISMQALRIKDKALHALMNFEGLYGGRYTFKNEGKLHDVVYGNIIVEGGVMKDFKAYNNTLAFINTLPELAMLKSPGFSQEGFVIQEGEVTYRLIEQKKIIFDSIYVKGASATIVGKGEVDLEARTIYIELAVQVARSLSKLIGNLPLVGYAIMGEDKSMTVGLKIKGDLDKPAVKTSGAKEVLGLPFRILKRTLEAPSKLIQNKNKQKGVLP